MSKNAFDIIMPKSSSPSSKRKTLDTTPNPDQESPSNSITENGFFKKQKPDEIPKNNNNAVVDQLKKNPEIFKPKSAGYWGEGKRVLFLFLAKFMDVVSNEPGRNSITCVVCNMLRTVVDTTPHDLVPAVYLLANQIAPPYQGLDLGIGDASIIKALAQACGATEIHIKKKYKELGDLGLVAKATRSSQPLMCKPQPLTVAKVFDTFRVIAKESGKDSQDKKKNHIKGLLVAATDCEPLYLIRLLQKHLRIGLGKDILLSALGHAIFYSQKQPYPQSNSPDEAAKILRQVYSVVPVYEKIIPALLSGGIWDLPKTCCFTLGVPAEPMLARSTKGVSEIFNKFQNIEFTCEYKYDGERAQIHYLEDGTVQIYSRNGERNTEKFPDVVAAVSRIKKPSVKSFVLDCELVAYDRQKHKILPFQILQARRRKNVVTSEIKVDVCIYAFDLLYLNGHLLLQEQLSIRREHLYESFEEKAGFFQLATAKTSNDLEEIQIFLDNAVNASCEGLIFKTLTREATYETKRSDKWLKLKKDYMDSIGDSLDLVPIGAFHGRGKRVGLYGAFLLACYDNNKDEYQAICKIGTGLSDQMLEDRSSSLASKVISKPKRCDFDLNIGQSSRTSPELPKAVVMTLNQGSLVTSMDFHPVQHTLLLVGTNTGEITIWDLRSRKKVVEKNFKLRNDRALSITLQESLRNHGTPSITRVTWSPDGTLLGGAYSKNIVHVYSYHGGDNMQLHSEIEAHRGSVTDLAFSNTNFLVTCGIDKSIKVWKSKGQKQKFYKCNETLIPSLCPRFNEFGFSTEIHAKIKLWSYLFSCVDHDEPRLSSSRMSYNVDATRLFLSGINNDGSPYLIEWNESNGTLKHAYKGLVKRATTMGDAVNFDTLNGRFIAVGDEYLVKLWDMDNTNLWTTVDAEGGLPASPCVKCNQQGALLSVSTLHKGIKILSNTDGSKLLKMNENSDALKVAYGCSFKSGLIRRLGL